MGDLSTSLGSGSNGLTAARAAERLTVVGPNSVEDAQRLGPLRLLWRQVESPLVLILIFAAADARGHGVGSALVQQVEQRLQQANVFEYQVRTVAHPANRALSFYRDRNFHPAGE